MDADFTLIISRGRLRAVEQVARIVEKSKFGWRGRFHEEDLSLEAVQDATPSTVDSRMPHFNVSCQTCRITKTFVTLQGVNAFFGEHEGHQVIEGRLFERPQIAKKPDAVEEVVAQPQVEEAPQVVAGSGEVVAQELKPQPAEAPEVVAESEEVVAQELKPQVKEGADAEVRKEEPAPVSTVVALAPVAPLAPSPQAIQSAETRMEEPVAAAPSPLSEKDLEEPLLLARSSYIGESREKRVDALRVSRALKEFKWNVEPPYVIGIMVDDNLSVETNIGVISNSMVERVEKLGYKFVAVNAPQGSPVAWFKREAQWSLATNSPVGDAETMMQISQGRRTYDKDKAVWQESFVSLLMSVKDMDGQNLKRVTNIIKSERPEPDLQS